MHRVLSIVLLWVAGLLPALAAAAYVQANSCSIGGSASTTCSVSLPSVAAGDSIIVLVGAIGNISTATISLSDSVSTTYTNVVPWANYPESSQAFTMGEFLANNVAAGSHALTVTLGTSESNWAATAIEVSGLLSTGSFDSYSTANAYGSSLSVTSPVPSESGEFELAYADATTTATWSAPLTSIAAGTKASGYQTLTGSTAVTSTVTAGGGTSFSGVVSLFKPSSSTGCTSDGYTATGAFAVPNGTSGAYWLQSGTFGTPNCSSTEYWQPKVGKFGVN